MAASETRIERTAVSCAVSTLSDGAPYLALTGAAFRSLPKARFGLVARESIPSAGFAALAAQIDRCEPVLVACTWIEPPAEVAVGWPPDVPIDETTNRAGIIFTAGYERSGAPLISFEGKKLPLLDDMTFALALAAPGLDYDDAVALAVTLSAHCDELIAWDTVDDAATA